MKIIFFGSSDFAVPSLQALVRAKEDICCVVTQPDRAKGRGLRLEATAVKNAAESSGVRVYQPQRINTAESLKFLQSLEPDLFIVISYGQILSREILEVPVIFAINAHASLLPKYRGAAPMNWSIIRGETVTGVSIMKMEEKMDAGPVILQEAINIDEYDTVATLSEKLSGVAARLVPETLRLIRDKEYNLTAQDEQKAAFAPKLKKQDGLIDWKMPAQDIHNLVRGTLDWPGAFTYYKGKLLKLYKVKTIRLSTVGHQPSAGVVIAIDKRGIILSTGKGQLLVEELQLEGKKRMSAHDFIIGHKISSGDVFGKK